MNKIVRTNLGIEPNRLTRIDLHSEEGLKYLKKKVLEEAQEVFESKTRKELAEELGDLLEVIDVITSQIFDFRYVPSLNDIKSYEKGGFIELDPHTGEKYLLVLDKEDERVN